MQHLTQDQLEHRLNQAATQVVLGGSYKHYSSEDNRYTVLQVVLNEQDAEPCVVYRAECGCGAVWVRSLDNFCSAIKQEDGQVVQRFLYMGSQD